MKSRAAQLEKQIKVLVNDSVALLKARMSELGINAASTGDLLKEAKEIVWRHRELQAKALQLQNQVTSIEQDQAKLVAQRQQEIIEKYKKNGCSNGINGNVDFSALTQEYILKEISATLSHRKKLQNHVTRLENELNAMEKVGEERKNHVNMTKVNSVSDKSLSSPSGLPKSPRKTREHRTRSQEWPDVPDVGKIEENNPEILAQKILETGRQIEAGKLSNHANKYNNQPYTQVNSEVKYSETSNNRLVNYYGNNQSASRTTNVAQRPEPNNKSLSKWKSNTSKEKQQSVNGNRTQEPPRLANFEDRLKSIITSVLNEDQNSRSRQQKQAQSPVPANPPAQAQQPLHPINDPTKQNNIALNGVVVQPTSTITSTGYQSNTFSYSSNGYVKQDQKMYKKMDVNSREKERAPRQPDYTQVSPAKLALRRHLSQEKLAAASAQQIQQLDEKGGLGYVATRSIGELVSGEIERTLEISNQHIINVAIDMSPILNVSTANTVMSANLPPRPVNARMSRIVEDGTKREEDRGTGTPSPLLRAVYSPISRPSSAEVGNPPTPTNIAHPPTILEGLAYPHRPKSPVNHQHHNLATLAHVAFSQQNFTPPAVYSAKSNNGYSYSSPRQNSVCRYTPVQLPRAEMKPYHESYFTETKDLKPGKVFSSTQQSFAPVEGLAATLHARILNDGLNTPIQSEVKEENDTGPSDCMLYDKFGQSRIADKRPNADEGQLGEKKHFGLVRNSVLSNSVIQNTVVKTEGKGKNYQVRNSSDSDRKLVTQKRSSPIIHGPIRPVKKSHVTDVDADVPSVVTAANQPLAISAISSPENNSGKSTPFNEDDRRPHEEGRQRFLYYS